MSASEFCDCARGMAACASRKIDKTAALTMRWNPLTPQGDSMTYKCRQCSIVAVVFIAVVTVGACKGNTARINGSICDKSFNQNIVL